MKLTILGTGNAMVTKCYNTCFAIENDGHYFLVDGGGGNTIMKQLKNADIDWTEMSSLHTSMWIISWELSGSCVCLDRILQKRVWTEN